METFSKIKQQNKVDEIKKEHLNPTYKEKRINVVSYLKKLNDNFKYSQSTYHLSLLLLDKILLQKEDIQFDLAAIGCMILAVKFVEYDPLLPPYTSFYNPQKIQYQPSEIFAIERLCLHILDYKLDYFSPYNILEFFLSNGLISKEDQIKPSKISNFYTLSQEVLNFFLLDQRSVDFTPFQIAVSSILLASRFINYQFQLKKFLSKVYEIDPLIYQNALVVIEAYFKKLN
jgi:hypothetical protein